jgi:diaminohydroxyphosphoribosylaminopyrimidine deaminase/5-amino-6-(5-phosphoribosylamino)uracil reductase
MFSLDDRRHMTRALQLAARGRRTTPPNPMVGAVLVRDGGVVGEGWHVQAGDDHAEIIALRDAGDLASGATLFVTLEPCSHHGRTPPCAEAVAAAGVSRVVAAMVDPNPAVSGKGLEHLEAAGIEVASGLLESQAAELNRGFIKRMREGVPWVTVKIAASLDGATAMASGESQWITGSAARADVQRLRAESGAVMTGVGTVIADDPRLTVREPDARARQPLRVILDSDLRTPVTAEVLGQPGETRIYFCGEPVREDLVERGAALVPVRDDRRGVCIADVLTDLGSIGINHVLVEAGAQLAGSLAAGGWVDEYVLYQAPRLLGSTTRPMLDTPGWLRLDQGLALDVIDTRLVGRDVRIVARPNCNTET